MSVPLGDVEIKVIQNDVIVATAKTLYNGKAILRIPSGKSIILAEKNGYTRIGQIEYITSDLSKEMTMTRAYYPSNVDPYDSRIAPQYAWFVFHNFRLTEERNEFCTEGYGAVEVYNNYLQFNPPSEGHTSSCKHRTEQINPKKIAFTIYHRMIEYSDKRAILGIIIEKRDVQGWTYRIIMYNEPNDPYKKIIEIQRDGTRETYSFDMYERWHLFLVDIVNNKFQIYDNYWNLLFELSLPSLECEYKCVTELAFYEYNHVSGINGTGYVTNDMMIDWVGIEYDR